MGYYNGNGITVSGSKSKNLFGTLLYNYGQHVYQNVSVTVNVKRGVQLSECNNLTPTAKSSKSTFSSTGDYPWMGINGKSISYSWNQIGDSNLYELITTTEEKSGTDTSDNI